MLFVVDNAYFYEKLLFSKYAATQTHRVEYTRVNSEYIVMLF